MDEPVPLLYYDDEEDNDASSLPLLPEVAHSSLAPIGRNVLPSAAPVDHSVLPSAAPVDHNVLPSTAPVDHSVLPSQFVFGDGTTKAHPSISGRLAPIVDWNNGTYKGR